MVTAVRQRLCTLKSARDTNCSPRLLFWSILPSSGRSAMVGASSSTKLFSRSCLTNTHMASRRRTPRSRFWVRCEDSTCGIKNP